MSNHNTTMLDNKRSVFNAIVHLIHTNGKGPTLREITVQSKLSHPTVLKYLDLLESEDKINRKRAAIRSKRRGISLVHGS